MILTTAVPLRTYSVKVTFEIISVLGFLAYQNFELRSNFVLILVNPKLGVHVNIVNMSIHV